MYTQVEQELIQAAQQWRESGNHESSITYDNTPYKDIGNGLRARATKESGKWVFKCIARQGFTGQTFDTLQQSVDHAVRENEEHRRQLDERIFANKTGE